MRLLAFLFLTCVVLIYATDDAPKVKIGIKERVEDCKLKARKGDMVNVHYTGFLDDGSEFDSSYSRDMPFSFTLGLNQVIAGWDQGILGMCEHEVRRLVIPPELAYGSRGAGNKVPPNAVLTFEVELLNIGRRQEL